MDSMVDALLAAPAELLPGIDADRRERSSALTSLSQWSFDAAAASGLQPVMATIHGSWLYNLAHKNSDVDLYVVHLGDLNEKRVVAGVDVAVFGLATYLKNLRSGSHQAVEALLSPYRVASPAYQAFFDALRPNPYLFWMQSERAVIDLDPKLSVEKRDRHERRLYGQSAEMLDHGWFDPSDGCKYR